MNELSPIRRSNLFVLAIFAVTSLIAESALAVELVKHDFQVRPLDQLPAGTVVSKSSTPGWSELLLFVRGSVGRGDVESAGSMVKQYASMFNLVYMADVKKDREGKYYLNKVGVGFSTNIKGRNTIITSDTHKRLGASLGMVGGMVFSANEKALKEIVQVARYRDGMMFDAPTIMLRDGIHKKVIVRFFVWVSPTGKVGTVVWTLDGATTGRYEAVDEEIVLLQPKLVENRVMNVDGNRFTFGVPSEDAFAVVSLPPGRAFRVSEELSGLIARRTYDASSFFTAITKLSQSLSSAK